MMKRDKIKSKIIFFSGLIIFASIFAWLVMAAAGDNVRIISSASGTNMTSVLNRAFNVSFDNTTDIPNALNATFFFNISGTWTKVGNTTATGCNVKAGLSSCAINLNATVADGVYSLNATIYNASASISVAHTANLTHGIFIDATPPQANSANFSNPFSQGANLSTNARGSNHTINVSIFDATIGVQSVIINITNSSGGQNGTFIATREGSTDNFVVANLNTSQFPDGEYNLTIYANDTLGNLNNSAVVQRVTFDNTPPSISSFTCTPNPVVEQETITCTCSATDSLSGLNASYGSSGVSFTANPSTTQTGSSFQTSCSTQDKAGNTASTTTTYEVQSSGSGGRSSGGSSSGGSSSGSSSGSGSAGLSPETTQGSQEPNTGVGSSAQGEGVNETESSSAGWIIGVIALIVVVIAITVMIKRRR